MKQISYLILIIFSVMMTGCEVIGGIFKAGVWTGLLLVAIVVGLIIFLLSRGRRK
jgi:hypothetical protein